VCVPDYVSPGGGEHCDGFECFKNATGGSSRDDLNDHLSRGSTQASCARIVWRSFYTIPGAETVVR